MPKTESSPSSIRIAVVGSGPSSFYAIDALQKSQRDFSIHLFEKLPFPHGLVRYGVAPDHQKIKSITKVFDRIAQNDNFEFWGNVQIGLDLSVDDLKRYYHMVIIGTGASNAKNLPIPQINIEGSFSATEFVAWYNGHPDCVDRSFDLSKASTVTIVGQGNVALDVARILGKDHSELSETDISPKALTALKKSSIRSIHLVGRRGLIHSAFTFAEIKELSLLKNCQLIIDPSALSFSPEEELFIENSKNKDLKNKIHFLKDYLLSCTKKTSAKRSIVLEFFQSPLALQGKKTLEKVLWTKNTLEGDFFSGKIKSTGEEFSTDTDLFIRSIGYRGEALSPLPFDENSGTIAHKKGRVLQNPFFYVVGWIKRGPRGLIGTNKIDSTETVQSLLEDLSSFSPSPLLPLNNLREVLREKNVFFLSYKDWMKIDAEEKKRGKRLGKIREKFTSLDQIKKFLL